MKCFIAFNMTVMIFGLLFYNLRKTPWTFGSAILPAIVAWYLGRSPRGRPTWCCRRRRGSEQAPNNLHTVQHRAMDRFIFDSERLRRQGVCRKRPGVRPAAKTVGKSAFPRQRTAVCGTLPQSSWATSNSSATARGFTGPTWMKTSRYWAFSKGVWGQREIFAPPESGQLPPCRIPPGTMRSLWPPSTLARRHSCEQGRQDANLPR